MLRRRYLVVLLAGVGMFFAVYLVDALLAVFRLHAEQTSLDDVLLGCVAAVLVFFLLRHHEWELRRQRQSAAVIEQMNHHIRNALQVIAARSNLGIRSDGELQQITAAIERIDWALREILPRSIRTSPEDSLPDGFAWPPPSAADDRSSAAGGADPLA